MLLLFADVVLVTAVAFIAIAAAVMIKMAVIETRRSTETLLRLAHLFPADCNEPPEKASRSPAAGGHDAVAVRHRSEPRAPQAVDVIAGVSLDCP
jgi:hypothetical protein